MGEVVAPADAEAAAVAYLKAAFAVRSETAKVATKVPPVRPERMVRVSLADTLEQTRGHFYSRLIFECWAADEPACASLARLSYALMRAAEGESAGPAWVAHVVTVSGPANFPDDVGPRYQFTLDLLIGGVLI
ncbi:hypothetical protein [Nocardia vulneris]|uniref:hypothetical protein n=1 Tax=Nocardia vulneris TaxID=1141657 RepID=UPI00068EDE2A|nr:hypothetical protein [Nocardia vulneris]